MDSNRKSELPIPRRNKCVVGIGVCAWLAIVTIGMLVLIDYSTAPGATAESIEYWPENSTIERDRNRQTLIVFLHPKCPCSRACLHQMTRLVAGPGREVSFRPVFFCPKGEAESWTHTDLWKLAAQLSDTPPVIDHDGRESKRFGAMTSGHVFLFAKTGERLYSGGITSGRGHEGDNPGLNAIERLIDGKPVQASEFSVYGCPIQLEARN